MSCIEIDEVNERVTYIKNNIRHEENFTFPNLSEMAGQFVESILLEGVCALTDIETSIILHKPFILEINSYFKNNFDLDTCPLT